MAIAHAQEFASFNPGSTADPFDIVCAATVTPNGVVAIIEQNGAETDQILSVSYGINADGVPLVRDQFVTEPTEAGGIYVYWAGGVVFPTGTQTLRIDRSAITSNIGVSIALLTVAAGKVVAFDSRGSGLSASSANPAWVHNSINPNVVAYLGIHSGLTTMTNTVATNWLNWPTGTSSFDIGAQGRGFARRTLAVAGSLGAGWTAATADDWVGASLALYETDPPVAVRRSIIPRERVGYPQYRR